MLPPNREVENDIIMPFLVNMATAFIIELCPGYNAAETALTMPTVNEDFVI